jgi:hypothetical protein
MLPENSDAASQSQLYDYKPLDLTKQQIRLITLKPGSADAPVQCGLETFDIDSRPPYLALSYTWGPPSPTACILIDGKHFEVRQNLYDFLVAFRNDEYNKEYIWIDQICISQSHTGERNHQVQLMSKIYEHCFWVIIWLGYESRDAAVAFNALKKNSLLRRFEHAKTLLRHRYFGRTWVVQEMLLPSGATVLCGDVWVQYEQLIDAIHDRPRGSSLGPEADNVDFHFQIVGMYRAFRRYGTEAFDLYSCTVNFTMHQCEDPRDKVYGLLGLIQDNRLVVDYTKGVQDVFVDVALIITESGYGVQNDKRSYWDAYDKRPWTEQPLTVQKDIHSLISSMGLQSSRLAITAFLEDMSRTLWTEGRQITSAGFDPQLERWWLMCDDTKYYRDNSNFQMGQPGRYEQEHKP